MHSDTWNPKRWRVIVFLLLTTVYCLLSTPAAPAQVQDRINRGCGGLGGALVQVLTDFSGNVLITTCTGKGVYINGTLITPGGPSGSGTAGTLPIWTAPTVLGNSYATQSGNNFSVTQPAGGNLTFGSTAGIRPNVQLLDTTGIFNINAGGINYFKVDGTNDRVLIGNQTAGPKVRIDSGANNIQINSGIGQTLIGDTGGLGNGVVGSFDDGSRTALIHGSSTAEVSLDGAAATVKLGDVQGNGNLTRIEIDDTAGTILVRGGLGRSGLLATNASNVTSVGDIIGNGNGTLFSVDDQNTRYTLNQLTNCALGIITDVGGNLACAVSDGRLKEKLAAYRGGLSALAKIHPQSYNFRAQTNYDPTLRHTGFIAQDIQAAVPEAVLGVDGQHLGVDNTALLATAINAINELNDKITALQLRVRRLTRQVRRGN